MPNTYTPEAIADIKRRIHKDKLLRPDAVKLVGQHWELGERQAREIYKRYFEGNEVPNIASLKFAEPSVTKSTTDNMMTAEVKTHDVQEIGDVVKLCKVDEKVWRVKSFAVSQNRSGAFVWRTSFERQKHMSQAFIDELKEDLKSVVIAPPKTKPAPVKGGRLLEIAAFDLHLGKLGWKPEAGGDYDIKIARDVYFAAINELVAKAQKQGPISRILFPVGNDYLTIDSDNNETTAGTPQDVDSRFAKIYREGRKILVEAIELLRQTAPVDVVVVPGNHDNVSMFHLGDALECWFHAHTDVKIDNEPISRKYYQFGRIMIGLCHGHLEKHDKLPNLAAVEQPAMWAATTYREWHTGHRHHRSAVEHMGTVVRILPSLSGADRYHHDNGYVGAKRIAQGFLFTEETLEAILHSTPVQG